MNVETVYLRLKLQPELNQTVNWIVRLGHVQVALLVFHNLSLLIGVQCDMMLTKWKCLTHLHWHMMMNQYVADFHWTYWQLVMRDARSSVTLENRKYNDWWTIHMCIASDKDILSFRFFFRFRLRFLFFCLRLYTYVTFFFGVYFTLIDKNGWQETTNERVTKYDHKIHYYWININAMEKKEKNSLTIVFLIFIDSYVIRSRKIWSWRISID